MPRPAPSFHRLESVRALAFAGLHRHALAHLGARHAPAWARAALRSARQNRITARADGFRLP